MAGRNTEHLRRIIPSAIRFDIENKFSNLESKLPNTFPSKTKFEKECRKLGITNDSQLVVYDNLGVHTSLRVWWMFKTMGHDNIKVLNGGLPEWTRKGFITEIEKINDFKKGSFQAQLKLLNTKSYRDILNTVGSKDKIVVDARSK